MGLVIEASINLTKTSKITAAKELLSQMAYDYNCNNEYFIHEVEGRQSTIERNECIHVVEFNTSEINRKIVQYLKTILQKKLAKIDTIYQDEGKIKVLYSSNNPNKPILSIINEYLI